MFLHLDVSFKIDLVLISLLLETISKKVFHLVHDKSATPAEPLLYFVAA